MLIDSRRSFVLLFLGMHVAFAAVSTRAADEEALTRRPNVLWIIVEDASPHVGCYGETTIATPHIDGLAEQGIRFDNAIVTNPVCSPCRSAMVTGMYAIRALEQVGSPARAVLPAIKDARKSPYEFTRRFARRLTGKLGD